MTNKKLLRRLLLLRDEYGDPRLYLGGAYCTLDRHVVICSVISHPEPALKTGSVVSLPELIHKVQQMQAVADEPNEYGFIVIGKMPSIDGEVREHDNLQGYGFYTEADGFCLENLRFSIAYQLKYIIRAKFPRIKPHKGGQDA